MAVNKLEGWIVVATGLHFSLILNVDQVLVRLVVEGCIALLVEISALARVAQLGSVSKYQPPCQRRGNLALH